MSCASKKSVPREEDEDLSRIPVITKRLIELENRKRKLRVDESPSTKNEVASVQKEIRENLTVLQIHVRQYAEAHGYETELQRAESKCTELESKVEKLLQETDYLQQTLEEKRKLELRVEEMADDIQDYRLRNEKLKENEERQNSLIDKVRKELEEASTKKYRLEDQNKGQEDTIARLEEKLTLADEEKETLLNQINSKDAELDRIPGVITEIESKFAATVSALNIKIKKTEADNFKLEGILAEKDKKMRGLVYTVAQLEEEIKKYQIQSSNRISASTQT